MKTPRLNTQVKIPVMFANKNKQFVFYAFKIYQLSVRHKYIIQN